MLGAKYFFITRDTFPFLEVQCIAEASNIFSQPQKTIKTLKNRIFSRVNVCYSDFFPWIYKYESFGQTRTKIILRLRIFCCVLFVNKETVLLGTTRRSARRKTTNEFQIFKSMVAWKLNTDQQDFRRRLEMSRKYPVIWIGPQGHLYEQQKIIWFFLGVPSN